MKSAVIDAFDTLAATTNPENRWQTVVELSQSLGFTGLNVARLDNTNMNLHWLNTSMRADWITEYIEKDYLTIDPLVVDRGGGPDAMYLQSGTLGRNDASRDMYNYNHGLKDAGFGTLRCARYGPDLGESTYVTLCSDADPLEMQRGSPIDLDLFSAMLSITITGAAGGPANDILQGPQLRISTRQREVLSLLASGYHNSGIADKLGITEVAVRKHFAGARRALNAATREQAMAIALQNGLLHL